LPTDFRPADQGDRDRQLLVLERQRQILAASAPSRPHPRSPVEDVRQATGGHVARPVVGLGDSLLARDLGVALGRQRHTIAVEQVGHAAAVGRAGSDTSLPTEGVELGRLELAACHCRLVGRDEHRRLGVRKQGSPHRGRPGVGPVIESTTENDEVGLGDGESSLLLDLLLDRVAGMDLEAAGVDDDEAPPFQSASP